MTSHLPRQAAMEVETVTCLLSGTSVHSSRLGRTTLAVFFSFRLGALALGAKTLWRDEERDFICNSSRKHCHTTCFDAYSPLSPFNLFTLQLVVVFTHALALANYFAQDSQAKGSWQRGLFRTRMGQARAHLLFLLAKAVIEGTFLFTFCQLYEGILRPGTVKCQLVLCEEHVTCVIQNADAKNSFNVFMLGASFSCVLLCLAEIYATVMKITQSSPSQKGTLKTKKANI